MYCYRCGVQLDDDTQSCPLCETPVPPQERRAAPDIKPEQIAPFPRVTAGTVALQRDGRVVSRVLSALLLPPIFPLLLIWYVQEPGMEWVLWTAAVFAAGWLISVPLRPLARWPLGFSTLAGLIGAGIVVGVDATNGAVDWSLQVAAPVALLAALAVGTVHRATEGFSEWGLPALAATVAWGAIVLSVADGLINRFYGEPFVGAAFGLVVVAAPVSAVSLYLHFGLSVRVDLGRFFHV